MSIHVNTAQNITVAGLTLLAVAAGVLAYVLNWPLLWFVSGYSLRSAGVQWDPRSSIYNKWRRASGAN